MKLLSREKIEFEHHYITGTHRLDLLCEEEQPVVWQTQEGAAGHNYFQQMVQFPESDYLLLQINLCAQVITLWN